MTTATVSFVSLNKMHASEDFATESFSNHYRVVEHFLREPNINAELQLTYKRKMVKRFSKSCKENMHAINWYIGLMEHIASRCGKFEPVVTTNRIVYDAISNEINVRSLEEQFDLDTRISHIDYKIKLMKVTIPTNNKNKPENTLITYDVVVERIYQIGGRQSSVGKYVTRTNLSNSRDDFYASSETNEIDDVHPDHVPQQELIQEPTVIVVPLTPVESQQ